MKNTSVIRREPLNINSRVGLDFPKSVKRKSNCALSISWLMVLPELLVCVRLM